jgi:hypothetical protein
MLRFTNETPIPEKVSPTTSVPADDRLPRIDEAPEDCSERRPSASKSSFLTILLRALSAWGT